MKIQPISSKWLLVVLFLVVLFLVVKVSNLFAQEQSIDNAILSSHVFLSCIVSG